jgi:hypothetical protein
LPTPQNHRCIFPPTPASLLEAATKQDASGALWHSWKGDAVKQIEVMITASNCAAFPPGSHAWAREDSDQLIELAGYPVEDITYSLTRKQVEVRTALGYQFIISTADYHRLVLQ